MKLATIFLVICLIASLQLHAEEVENLQKRIELRGGSVLNGNIIHEDQNLITIRTFDGEIIVKRESVISIQSLNQERELLSDPKATRLLFSPTGRPLKKGSGYFTDFYVFLPSISYGFNDRFSVMTGMSVVPGIGIGDQLKYIAPRYTLRESDNSATAAGFLNVFVNGGTSAGILYATHTIGRPDKSFTAAMGWGYLKEKSEELDFHPYPIVMLGGNIRLGKHTAFVTENWLITGENIKNYPFVMGLRFFSKHIAVDVGAMYIADLIGSGIPIPWLSFAYHFD